MILRNCDVARIAHQVDHFAKAHIERLVAFHDARTRQLFQEAFREDSGRGKQLVDVGKADVLIGINQIGQQKPHPGIAGLGIGDEEGVVGKNGEAVAGAIEPEQSLHRVFDLPQHRSTGLRCQVSGVRKTRF